MGKQSFTAEDKVRIIGEYHEAVAAGNGGGKDVAARYGLHSANIIAWAKSRDKAAPKAARASRRPALGADDPVVLTAKLDATVDALIVFHQARIDHLRKMREGYSA